MKIYNSFTNQKEEFKPIEEGKVGIYVCGPTVYNYVHIGNTRPMIIFDVLRRTFEYLGYDVTFVSNYTDVDDKIIKKAKEEGVSEKELTEKYIKAYEDVRNGLNIETPTHTPRVTETMDKIIAFVAALIEKGYAYESQGDVYFRVSKIKDYGHLSGIHVEDLIQGASERTSTEDDDKKESSLDFALWKKTNEGIQFDSPWSKGRPGWHTECVVMINDIFGRGLIDIHGGGYDLKFPHHENEIAQAIAYSNTHLANYWMHNQMININGEKMSKSLGNVLWAKDLLVKL
ncbi:MAG TPA: cysteine--tRNA ligase, partial [Erysipelotrichaceae bacterium]|nr:cysteine--tRNA ligase [Erysipelotrichaceae bacterium]